VARGVGGFDCGGLEGGVGGIHIAACDRGDVLSVEFILLVGAHLHQQPVVLRVGALVVAVDGVVVALVHVGHIVVDSLVAVGHHDVAVAALGLEVGHSLEAVASHLIVGACQPLFRKALRVVVVYCGSLKRAQGAVA
jgi:hypothetical protein